LNGPGPIRKCDSGLLNMPPIPLDLFSCKTCGQAH
jgi:hypothetical protein